MPTAEIHCLNQVLPQILRRLTLVAIDKVHAEIEKNAGYDLGGCATLFFIVNPSEKFQIFVLETLNADG
jgi:hypothetical protein